MGLSLVFAVIWLQNFNHFHAAAAENSNLNPPNYTLETYIVYLQPNPQITDLHSYYDSFMPSPSTASQSDGQPRMIYRYDHVFTGFAAKLSAKDVEAMQRKKGFVAAHKEEIFELFTTHTPNFLGLNQNSGFWNASNYGKGVIIGVLDTGITPDHPSFSGEGIPPPRKKWKGKCDFKSPEACNNKLIGARSLRAKTDPTDLKGHGTHTSATAAGNFVEDANVFGLANGTASGIAPLAHLAMYRVCYDYGCYESEVLAGFDAAIDDGVDIISISLGSLSRQTLYQSNIAIGSYAAFQKGIFVSCAAGNAGPSNTTVANDAPWILTVGASTHDRTLDVAVVLGDSQNLLGQSGFQPIDANVSNLELAFPNTTLCDTFTERFEGKIVVCEMGGFISNTEKGLLVKQAGGAAMILINIEDDGNVTLADPVTLPAAEISFEDGLRLKSYAKSTAKPVASLVFKGTHIGDKNAPIVAGFSARGPSFPVPGILKPDIIGPGVNVLAAWKNNLLKTEANSATFNILSGTSMATPHLSGVAALLKSAHPDWSPAAMKSAIITTAQPLNLDKKPILDQNFKAANAYDVGAGQVNPSLATDPGLIYDLKVDEYIPYLCGLNYSSEAVSVIVRRTVNCGKEPKISEAQLNYPSFSIKFGTSPQIYKRTVTNVGEANSSYEVKIESHPSVSIRVEPTKLSFTKVGEQRSYNVTFTRSWGSNEKEEFGQGSITWTSPKNIVRSPVGFIFS